MLALNFIRSLIISAVLGYLVSVENAEAKSINQPETQITAEELPALLEEARSNGLLKQFEQADEEDDDDDKVDPQATNIPGLSQQNQALLTAALQAEQSTQKSLKAPNSDLKTSASHHYHGHGAKGWLDMGAWTGKKGAFGWYDKHPVGGKGK